MSIERRVRIPFIPLDRNNTEITPSDRELVVDYANYTTYVNISGVGLIKVPTSLNIEEMISIEYNSLLDGVDSDGDSLEKLKDLLKPLSDFMKSVNDSEEYDVTLSDIIEIFNKLGDTDILTILNNKVDKVIGMGLSENDFTDALLSKINSVEEEANRYVHPATLQCALDEIVNTVNGKRGAVIITRMDIAGLENVDPYANLYLHPSNQQCSHVFRVNRVHGREGHVTVTKQDLGLSEVENFDTAKIEDLHDSNDSYLTTQILMQYIKDHINRNL